MSRCVRSRGTPPGGQETHPDLCHLSNPPPFPNQSVLNPSRPACLGKHSTLSVSFWYGSYKNHRPLTVPRGSPIRPGQGGDTDLEDTYPNRLSVSAAGRDQRSQSTFIAVAGLDCVEKLTEQWVQLWPRSARLVSPPISRPDAKHSDSLIYVLLVFHHSSSIFSTLPPWLGVFRGRGGRQTHK